MLCYLQPDKAIINDLNSELITSYKSIKKNHNQLITLLDELTNKHDEKNFYAIRETIYEDELHIAARFMYLNKTCFNGLYRVNSQGKFNVPFNGKSKDKLHIYVKENIEAWSQYLKKNKVKICNKQFDAILDMATSGDFVYCDPPYDYEVNTTGFDSYNKDSFGQAGQIKLANKLKELDAKGVR